MLKFFAVLFITHLLFGACKAPTDIQFEEVDDENKTTKFTTKMCKKGCFASAYDDNYTATACKSCKDITAREDGGVEVQTKEEVCKETVQCWWKVGCLPGSCPSIVAAAKDELSKCKSDEDYTAVQCEEWYGKTQNEFNAKASCKHLGCLYKKKERSCSILSLWALIVIIVVVVVVVIVIIVVIIVVILMLSKKPAAVDPTPAAAPAAKTAPKAEETAAAPPADAAPADAGPPPEVGPYVVIKLGKQESKTKKVESAVWGQDLIFTGLGPEDDDVMFELHDNSDALLGSTDVRIPDYVNAKKRATVSLKNGEEAIGVLEVDIEIQVEEEPEVKITGVFFVDKFVKA